MSTMVFTMSTLTPYIFFNVKDRDYKRVKSIYIYIFFTLFRSGNVNAAVNKKLLEVSDADVLWIELNEEMTDDVQQVFG